MNPSQKYPGLCKPVIDHSEYGIEFGSGLIDTQPSPPEVTYFGYKTFAAKNDLRTPIKNNNRYQIPSSAFDASINQQSPPSSVLTQRPYRFFIPTKGRLQNKQASADPFKTYRWDLLFNN